MARIKQSKIGKRVGRQFAAWNRSLSAYLARRPHRSFRRTLPRDYARSFVLPSYLGLTRETFTLIARNWRLLGGFFVIYSVASVIVLGVVNQSNYSSLVSGFKTSGTNIWLETLAIFGTAITGGLNPAATTNGQALASLLVIIAWLVMIWLLRHIVSGKRIKLRDGLYNAGAPLIPMTLVALVAIVQCIPLVLVLVGYTAASATGLLANGIEAMVFFAAAALLVVLSLYWLVSTFIALVIVTLPGMYPFAALRAAGDLVVGRRLRLILRMIWLMLVVVIGWAIILIPIILLDNAVQIAWLPLVPVCVLALTTATLIVTSTYIYVLYRKLVDDEAKPA